MRSNQGKRIADQKPKLAENQRGKQAFVISSGFKINEWNEGMVV